MKVLYAIQGTGNGHLGRAMEIVPILKRKAEVDVLVSGVQGDLELPFDIDYKFKGLSFIFGKKGGVDLLKTFINMKTKKLLSEIHDLPIEKYDLIINDFEPVSAWAAYYSKVPCIGLSHQAAVLHKSSPRPSSFDLVGQMILKYYAPVSYQLGFHFDNYDKSIFKPVIRNMVRSQVPEDIENYYTVYLPAYDDERLVKHFTRFKDFQFEIFSKHNKTKFREKNVIVRPINSDKFVKTMAKSEGVICGAGFETPAEALFLKKKLLVIPMKNQYEQQCNAEALRLMGVPVVKSLKKKHYETIEDFLHTSNRVSVSFPNDTEKIIDKVLSLPLDKIMEKSYDSVFE